MEISRPDLPESYGLNPPSETDYIQWPDIEQKVSTARNYWIGTVTSKATPHVAPVWGVWHESLFYFGTDRKSRKARNIDSNPSVNLHLESGEDVVIIEGEAGFILSHILPEKVADLYLAKYGIQLRGNPVYRIIPRKILAWDESAFPDSATRWMIKDISS
jgi:hypothetical protein